MILDLVELHNVAEAHPAANGGVRLQRVPESVRMRINETAQMRMLQPDNCEIRFVCGDGPAQVTLSSEGETDLAVFQGTFDARARHRIGSEPVTIRIEPSANPMRVDPAILNAQPFRPNVMRLIAGGRHRDPLVLHDVSGRGVRPPTACEVPRLRYLAYGTSITQGFDCEAAHLSYVGQTAWGLRADLLNMGVGGSCFCEAALADYFASRSDWHVATLELSVNMGSFSIAQFSQRVRYMVNTVAGSNPSRLVACITLFPHGQDMGTEWNGAQAHSREYRQALRDAVRDCPHANVHLIEGPQLLRRVDGLAVDLVHPSDHAMTEIGRNLVERLEALLQHRARAE
jgi:hypothetical protein